MVFPPLGLWWLWSVLEQAGHEVSFIDMSEHDFEPKDIPHGFDAYLVSGTSPQGREIRKLGAGIENVAAKKSTGEVLFYHNDHLGGVNVSTDDAGSRVQLIEYDPWGKVSRDEGIGDSVRRFSGRLLDPESGLYYSGGRYYDPELGRFISPDPFLPQPSDPQSLDRYPYVLNNLVNDIDPDGCFHIAKKKKKKCKLN